MTARVAIHGFGRTGRQVFKALWEDYRDSLEVVALGVRDASNVAAAAHLLKYDSNYGRFPETVIARDGALYVADAPIRVVEAENPSGLPWGDLDIDIAVEATGVWTSGEEAAGHIAAGAGSVVVTAPCDGADLQVIYGVNHTEYRPAEHHVISAGSDTTNALAPVLQALSARFEVKTALMTAVGAYTNAQKLLDATDGDLRRARSAPQSIVPTTTRAPKAVASVFPDMAGRIGGYAVRVPVPTVSMIEVVAHLAAPATEAEVNDAFRAAATGPLAGILGVEQRQLVSSDYKRERRSAVVDASLTQVVGPLVKVSAWFDNEWGYASRVADVAAMIARGGAPSATNGRSG